LQHGYDATKDEGLWKHPPAAPGKQRRYSPNIFPTLV
jgi:hypothetical protein